MGPLFLGRICDAEGNNPLKRAQPEDHKREHTAGRRFLGGKKIKIRREKGCAFCKGIFSYSRGKMKCNFISQSLVCTFASTAALSSLLQLSDR